MIDIILVIILCFQLYRIAEKHGVSPWPYILNYVSVFILLLLVMLNAFVYFFGAQGLQTKEGVEAAMMFEPVALAIEVAIFFYLKKRIQRMGEEIIENDDTPDNTPHQKKDLSYFR